MLHMHGHIDTLCRCLGIGHALSNARIAFAGDRCLIARNHVPLIAPEGGVTIPLRSYFNSSFPDTVSTADHLPSMEEIREMAEMVGARIVDIVARGNDIYVAWHIKRKGNPMKDIISSVSGIIR